MCTTLTHARLPGSSVPRPRDRYRGAAAASLVESDTASLVGDGREGSRLLVVDNGGPARTVDLAPANGEGFAGLQVAVPADSRVRLPLAVGERTVRVVASVDGSEDRYEWRPLANGALYVAADGPRVLRDLLRRPLEVTNRTDAVRRVTVGVADGTGERFESGFRLEPNERAVREGVVAPAGSYEIRVETGDGSSGTRGASARRSARCRCGSTMGSTCRSGRRSRGGRRGPEPERKPRGEREPRREPSRSRRNWRRERKRDRECGPESTTGPRSEPGNRSTRTCR